MLGRLMTAVTCLNSSCSRAARNNCCCFQAKLQLASLLLSNTLLLLNIHVRAHILGVELCGSSSLCSRRETHEDEQQLCLAAMG